MPDPPEGRVDLTPDWVCEILSPSTRQYDLSRTLHVSALEGGRWFELGAWREHVRAAPFDELELDISVWWRGANAER